MASAWSLMSRPMRRSASNSGNAAVTRARAAANPPGTSPSARCSRKSPSAAVALASKLAPPAFTARPAACAIGGALVSPASTSATWRQAMADPSRDSLPAMFIRQPRSPDSSSSGAAAATAAVLRRRPSHWRCRGI